MTNPYPIPSGIRQTGVLLGTGVATYGPFAFKIFDIADVQVWTRAAGAKRYTRRTDVTVGKVSNLPLDNFAVTFPAPLPGTTRFVVTSARLGQRSAGVDKGTRLDMTALEKELSTLATSVQELRRDIDRAWKSQFGENPVVLDADIADNRTLMKVGDTLQEGPDIVAAEQAAAASAGEAAQQVQLAAGQVQLAAGQVSLAAGQVHLATGKVQEAAAKALDAWQAARSATQIVTGLVLADKPTAQAGVDAARIMSSLQTKEAIDFNLDGQFSRKIPREFFGLHFSNAHSGATVQTPYHDFGNGSVRLWDSKTPWRFLEPTKGNYVPTIMDELVNLAHAAGKQILYTLGQPPNWATGGVKTGIASDSYNATPPTNNQDWIDYITWVATRYLGKIKHYQIWNEVNHTSFYTGTVGRMVELTQLAYQTIKAIDPTATIVGPSTTGDAGLGSGPSYQDQLLAAGIANWIDVLAIHLYVFPLEPEGVLERVRNYRGVMAKHGVADLPIWNTEFSYHTFKPAQGASNVTPPDNVMSDERGASTLVRLMLMSWIAGVDRSFIYALDHPWSAIRMVNIANPAEVLKAGKAYKALADLLTGSRVVDFGQSSDGLWTATIARPDGERVAVSWANDFVTVRVNASAAGWAAIKDIEPTSVYAATGGFQDISSVKFIGKSSFNMMGADTSPKAVVEDGYVITENRDFSVKSGGIPIRWAVGSMVVTPSDDPAFGPNAIALTPVAQYNQIRQELNKPLEPGRYKLVVVYKTQAAGKWYATLEAQTSSTGAPYNPGRNLDAAAALTRVEVPFTVAEAYNVPLKFALVSTQTADFFPVHLKEYWVEKVGKEPDQPEPYTKKYVRTTTKALEGVTFSLDDEMVYDSANLIRTEGFLGQVCRQSGTLGTLPAMTANVVSGSPNFELSVADGVKIGDYITFNGGLRKLVIGRTDATHFTLGENAGISASAAVVAYAAPLFDPYGLTLKGGTHYSFDNVRLDWGGTWDEPFRSVNGNRHMWTSTGDLMYKNGPPAAATDGQSISRSIDTQLNGINAPSLGPNASGGASSFVLEGAEMGDVVSASFTTVDSQGIQCLARVSAANTVSYFFFNPTGSTIDLAPSTIVFKVTKKFGGA